MPASRFPKLALILCLALSAQAQDYPASRVVPAIGGEGADLVARTATPPLGLPAVSIPARNPMSADKVALGRKLFFDRRLSFNRTLSCAMCHVPEQGFTQWELKTPVGIEGRFVNRNAPTLLNVGYREVLFHDGREDSLENQVWQPLLKTNEMANPSIGFVLQTIREAPDYDGMFDTAFSQGLTAETVGMALASYQRALVAGDSPFDRWYFGGNQSAMSAEAARGWQLFQEKGCISCHTVGDKSAQFTNEAFYDTGIGYARSMGIGDDVVEVQLAPGVIVKPTVEFAMPEANDLGRYEATGRSEDRWLYRVPSLRNVAITPPYMHDGSLPDLAAVIDYYNAGGIPHEGLDPRLRPLKLDRAQRAALVAFLESLTSNSIAELVEDARSQPIGDHRQ